MRMKNLFHVTFLVALFCSGSFSLIGQNSNHFVQELVGSDFNQITAVVDGVKVILRDDRIDFMERNSDESFSLIFENTVRSLPTGVALKREEQVKNPNTAMAAVLGQDYITRKYFDQVKYSSVINGEDIIVSLVDGKLKIETMSSDGIAFRSFNEDQIRSIDNGITVEDFGRKFQVVSEGTTTSVDKNKSVKFAPNTRRSTRTSVPYLISFN